MKKIVTILTLIPFLFFASCSKEENQTSTETNKLIGRWVAESDQIHLDESEYSFKSDGTFTGLYIDLIYDGNKVTGKKKLPYSGVYSVSVDGKWLTIIEDGDDPDKYYIKFNNDKKFSVSEYEGSQQVIATYNKQ